MAKILILGAEGMLGSAALSTLSSSPVGSEFDIIPTSRSITNDQFVEFSYERGALTGLVKSLGFSGSDYVVNCAGWIPQRASTLNHSEIQAALSVNCDLPTELSIAAVQRGFRVITIGTDCVFSGQTSDPYFESTPLSPVDFYGFTKAIHESTNQGQMIIRTSIIGESKRTGLGLYEWFKSQSKGATVKAYTDHFWNGTSTHFFSRIVAGVIAHDEFLPGVQHLVPRDSVSKARLLSMFQNKLNRGDLLLEPMETGRAINRVLASEHTDRNSRLWSLGGFESIPSIQEVVDSL